MRCWPRARRNRRSADFDRAIALRPDFAAAYCNRGNAFQAKSEYDRAIRDYTVALQLKPDLAAALNNRASTYDRKGLHDMARKDRAAAAALRTPAAAAGVSPTPAPPVTPTPGPLVAPPNNNRLLLMIGGGVLGLLLIVAIVVSAMRGMTPQLSITDANAKADAAFQQKDYTDAMKYYLMAANQGDASAQYNVAWLYDNGDGVTQDYGQALQWYLKSANQGDRDAQNNLGELYYYGHGTSVDYASRLPLVSARREPGRAERRVQHRLALCQRPGRHRGRQPRAYVDGPLGRPGQTGRHKLAAAASRLASRPQP